MEKLIFSRCKADFNPHSREGSDSNGRWNGHEAGNFNPHSREGSDDSWLLYTPTMDISIHTPAKGVTSAVMCDSASGEYFNPHSREGSDKGQMSFDDIQEISIHTPAKGVTH